jgi:hypothetical protein
MQKTNITALTMNKLPIELQQHIWKTYHSMYVIEELKVMQAEGKSDYETVYSNSVDMISNTVNELHHFYTTQPLQFAIAIDTTIDRIITDEWYCFDSTRQMHTLAEMVSRINHPSLLLIDLIQINSKSSNDISNKVENLESVRKMILQTTQ